MQFRDISSETDSVYALTTNEEAVFFALNRSGEITINLAGSGAKAFIFTFFTGDSGEQTLTLRQQHSAPDTSSAAVTRAVLMGTSEAHYHGFIHIEREASRSSASQESRAILLSPEARHTAEPSLEILPEDVTCHHKASAGPLNAEALYYLTSRGLTLPEAKTLLVRGFLEASLEHMAALGVSENTLHSIRTQVLASLPETL